MQIIPYVLISRVIFVNILINLSYFYMVIYETSSFKNRI